MNVKEIVKKYLEDNRFDGLCNLICGCEIEDLMPCEGSDCLDVINCETGYKNFCKD